MADCPNREEFAEDSLECPKDDACQLIYGHGGQCDTRREEARWVALEEAFRCIDMGAT